VVVVLLMADNPVGAGAVGFVYLVLGVGGEDRVGRAGMIAVVALVVVLGATVIELTFVVIEIVVVKMRLVGIAVAVGFVDEFEKAFDVAVAAVVVIVVVNGGVP